MREGRKEREPLPATFVEEVPTITITRTKLKIEITLQQLVFIIENNSDEPCKVNKPKELLRAFKKHLEKHATGNAVEKGMSNLQQLFDETTTQVLINEDDILTEIMPKSDS